MKNVVLQKGTCQHLSEECSVIATSGMNGPMVKVRSINNDKVNITFYRGTIERTLALFCEIVAFGIQPSHMR